MRLVGLVFGLYLGMRLHWFQEPRPFPRQLAALLQGTARLRYLDPEGLVDLFGVTPDMTILELGCGTGTLTLPLAQRLHDSGQILALDIQSTLAEQARSRIVEAGLEARVCFFLTDLHSAPLSPHTTDLIVLGSVLGEIPDRHACLTRLFEIAKPDSRLVIYDEVLNPATMPPAMARMHLHAAGFRFGGQIRKLTHYVAMYYKDAVAFDPDLPIGSS